MFLYRVLTSILLFTATLGKTVHSWPDLHQSTTELIDGSGFQDDVLSTAVFPLEQDGPAHVQRTQPVNPVVDAPVVPDSDPTLLALRTLAAQVEEKVHVPGYTAFTPPRVLLDAGTGVSYFSYRDKTVHEARFSDLPAPMQDIWRQWSSYTPDEPTGKALFDDMFYRFFFVHELGHWMAGQVIAGLPESERSIVAKNEANNRWAAETTANRISIAWYREHDPQYLAKLVADFRRIQSHLPDPFRPVSIRRPTSQTTMPSSQRIRWPMVGTNCRW